MSNKVGDLLATLVIEADEANDAAVRSLKDSFNQVTGAAEKAGRGTKKAFDDVVGSSAKRGTHHVMDFARKGGDALKRFGKKAQDLGTSFKKTGKKIGDLGQSITTGLTKPALIAAGALAAITLGGGFGRLKSIDSAKAKINALAKAQGKQVDMDAIMKSSLDSVKGTAFGLGEATTAAAAAMATGLKPGKELTKRLKLIGDTAAIADTSMGEMGSQLNSVANIGTAYTMDLRQMANAGIDIYGALADSLDISKDEVGKWAQDGKISSKMFFDALESNVGGAAKFIGENTVTGAFANLKAAVGRLGASFLGAGDDGEGMFDKLKPVFKELTDWVDTNGPKFEEWGRKAGDAFVNLVEGAKKLYKWWSDLSPEMKKLVGWIAAFVVFAGPALIIVGKLVTAFGQVIGVVGGLIKVLGFLLANPVVAAVALIVGGLVYFFTQTELGQAIVAKAWGYIKDQIEIVVNWWTNTAQPALIDGWDAVKGAVSSVADWFKSIPQKFRDAIGGVKKTAGNLGTWWDKKVVQPLSKGWETATAPARKFGAWLEDNLFPIFTALGDLFGAVGDRMVEVWDWAVAKVKKDLDTLGGWFDAAMKPISWLWDKLWTSALDTWDIFADNIGKAWNFLTAVWSVVWEVIKLGWESLMMGLTAVWNTVGKPMLDVFAGAWEGVKVAFKAVWDIIVKILEIALAYLADQIKIVTAIINGDWSGAWELIKSSFTKVWDGIQAILRIALDALIELGKIAWNTFKKSLDTFLTGIKKAWNDGWEWIKQVGKKAWSWIKDTASDLFEKLVAIIIGHVLKFEAAWTLAWQAIKFAGQKAWNWIKDTASTAFKATIDYIVDKLDKLKSAWGTFWNGLKSVGSTAWNWIKDTAVGVFGKLKTAVINVFDDLKTGISNIWKKIKGVVAKPINAVISFINKGVVGGYNAVADFLKLPTMGTIDPIPGYAGGGYIDRPWSAGNRDPYLGMTPRGPIRFEGEEFIVNRKQTQKHRALLEQINSGSFSGPVHSMPAFSGGGEVPGFAGGGLVTFKGKTFTALFAKLLKIAEQMGGGNMHISQGGWRPRTSYSGTSHAGDAVDITRRGHQRFIAPLRSLGIPAWDRTGMGNWVSHTHGIPLPGSGTPRGSAIWQGQDYLRGGNGLGGRDKGPRGANALGKFGAAIMAAFDAGFTGIKDWFGGIWDKVTGPFKAFQDAISGGGGMISDMAKGLATKLKDELEKWIKDKIGFGSMITDDKDNDGKKDKVGDKGWANRIGMGYSSGTVNAMRGLHLVGEDGPELVNFRGGEVVFTAAQTKALMATLDGALSGAQSMSRATVGNWAPKSYSTAANGGAGVSDGSLTIGEVNFNVSVEELEDAKRLADTIKNLPRELRHRGVRTVTVR